MLSWARPSIPRSLIDIKTGATMMRYAIGTTTRERLRPQRVLGDGETTYHQAIRGSACGLAEGCGCDCVFAARFEVLTGFKWARSFGCSGKLR